VACAKLYDCKAPITAADLLNERVNPFFDRHDACANSASAWRKHHDKRSDPHSIVEID
jgi:hypothetical protein